MLHIVPLRLHFGVGDVAADQTGEGHPCVLSPVPLKGIAVLSGVAAFRAVDATRL